MPYDPELVERVREVIAGRPGFDERRMFGGVAFLLHGHIAVAASGRGGLMVRVSRPDFESLVGHAHVEPMTMGGREMRGWLLVHDPGMKTARQLRGWVDRGIAFARDLPPK